MRKLAFFAVLAAIVWASIALAFSPAQKQLLWQSSSQVHDGISLDFVANRFYVKAPGQAARFDRFENLFTVTRNSLGTFLGANGLIQFANENQFQFSEDISNAFWSKNAATVSANTTTSPVGTATADTLTADAGAGTLPRYADTSALTLSNVKATASVFAKAGTWSFVQIYVNNDSSLYANFNVSTCALGTTGGTVTAVATPVTGGFCRISMTYASPGADRRPFFLLAASSSATRAQAWSPAGTETVIFWGSQFQWGAIGGYLAATGAAKKYDQPRIEFDINGETRGILIEALRTNVILQAEDFNTTWANANGTVSVDTIAAPDGNTTADTITEDATASVIHGRTQTFTGTDNTVYAFSVWLKSGTRTWAFPRIVTQTGGVRGAYVNLATCTLGTVSGSTTARAISFPQGWCRASVVADIGGTGAGESVGVLLATGDGTNSYNGDGASYLYAWGAQLETASFASSYIPTTTSSVTRSAEVVTRAVGPEFNPLAGTMFAEADALYSTAADAVPIFDQYQIDAGANTNRYRLYHYLNSCGGAVVTSSVNEADLNNFAGITFGPDVMFKSIMAFTTNNARFACNGTLVTGDTSVTLPTVTTHRVGGAGLSALYGHVRRLEYWPERKSDAFIQIKSLPGKMSALTPANDNALRAAA